MTRLVLDIMWCRDQKGRFQPFYFSKHFSDVLTRNHSVVGSSIYLSHANRFFCHFLILSDCSSVPLLRNIAQRKEGKYLCAPHQAVVHFQFHVRKPPPIPKYLTYTHISH